MITLGLGGVVGDEAVPCWGVRGATPPDPRNDEGRLAEHFWSRHSQTYAPGGSRLPG